MSDPSLPTRKLTPEPPRESSLRPDDTCPNLKPILDFSENSLKLSENRRMQGEQEMANCRVCGVELTEDEEFDGICEDCAFDEETDKSFRDWI